MTVSAPISALPTELVVYVSDGLDRLKDLSSLALVNRKFYNIVNTILYKRAAYRGDAWPLAWGAHCGVAGTVKKALAAGISPNSRCNDSLPLSEGRNRSRAARLGVHDDSDNEVWDTDNEQDSNADDDDLSPETEDSDHATTIDTNQPPSNSNSEPWGTAINDSDHDISDVSLDDSDSELSDADSSILFHSPHDYDERHHHRSPGALQRSFFPIHLAARGGHNHVIGILLDHGALTNVASQRLCGCTRLYGLLNAAESPEEHEPPAWLPLHTAICSSHPDTAILLLSRGASHMMEFPLVPDHTHGNTALHHAAAMGLVDVVKYLLDQGIQTEVDITDEKTLTPFYHAYANRRWDSTVPLLLQRGANINVDIKMFLPYSTITPLGEACRLGNFGDADRLLDLGADPTHGFIATSTGGALSPLHMCCMPSARPASRSSMSPRFEEDGMGARRMSTIENLVTRGAVLEAKDCSGDTPLMIAVQNRNVPALRAVIKAGADIHQRNGVGRNAVMQAIVGPSQHGQEQTSPSPVDIIPLALTLRELLNKGARLDETDSDGNTILHVIFNSHGYDRDHSHHTETLRTVLNTSGASDLIRARNNVGHTALTLAFLQGNLDACEVLVRKGCQPSQVDQNELVKMLNFATHTDSIRALEFVLDLDTTGGLTCNAAFLSELLSGSHIQVLAATIIGQRGIPDATTADLTRLLCQALEKGEYNLAYSLLQAGADANGPTAEGKYPLVAFAQRQSKSRSRRPFAHQILQALVDRGANIHLSTFPPCSHTRIINGMISWRMEEELAIMLKKQPLANDPRAVGGLYLHQALCIEHPHDPPNEKIIDLLLSSGANISEVNEFGETPLCVLLRSLCEYRHFTWRYHRYFRRLFCSEVDINRPDSMGKSIADYLETLMQKSAHPDQTTFLTRRIQLVDFGGGVKVLKFLPCPQKRVKPGTFVGLAQTDPSI